MPLVSVIMPVYNSAAFLKGAVANLLQQSYPEIELIIVDDASTDNTYSIAQSFAGGRIKVLQQNNSGAAVARNTGLLAATGDYVQFMDVDDFLSGDKIEKQVAVLEKQPNKVAVCNYINFVNDSDLSKSLPQEDQSRFIYSTDDPVDFLLNLWGANGESNFIQTNCWLVPRVLVDKAGPWRNYRCPDDDGEFFARILLASEGVIYVPGILNYYRRDKREGKLSANSNKKYVQNTLLTIDLKYRYLEEKRVGEKMKKAFAKQYLDFAVENYPQHKTLSLIALKRFGNLDEPAELPLLGGKEIEFIKRTLGWKYARLLKHYTKQS